MFHFSMCKKYYKPLENGILWNTQDSFVALMICKIISFKIATDLSSEHFFAPYQGLGKSCQEERLYLNSTVYSHHI